MRAAWRVFDGAFKAGKTKKMRRHLETIADRLGAVRDLDVLIEGLEAYRLGLDEEQRPGLEPLLSLWRRQRATARTQLLGELDSDRYASFVNEMDGFLDAGANAAAAVATPTAPHRVRDRAASEIWAAYEAVRVYELVLPWADVETLHELRIATKWLRYGLEFFGETLGPDCARLLARVVALQDHLGSLHDADVATKLARDLLVARCRRIVQVGGGGDRRIPPLSRARGCPAQAGPGADLAGSQRSPVPAGARSGHGRPVGSGARRAALRGALPCSVRFDRPLTAGSRSRHLRAAFSVPWSRGPRAGTASHDPSIRSVCDQQGMRRPYRRCRAVDTEFATRPALADESPWSEPSSNRSEVAVRFWILIDASRFAGSQIQLRPPIRQAEVLDLAYAMRWLELEDTSGPESPAASQNGPVDE